MRFYQVQAPIILRGQNSNSDKPSIKSVKAPQLVVRFAPKPQILVTNSHSVQRYHVRRYHATFAIRTKYNSRLETTTLNIRLSFSKPIRP